MTNLCEGRVVIVTGAGGGIGRAHALAFAAQGAKVVVNDLGGSRDGTGSSSGPAEAVVREIVEAGGEAVADGSDVSDFEGAEALVQRAVTSFGRLDVLVNNAGILRDRMLVNMTPADWDAVINVHLRGTFGPSHHAAAYWRSLSKAGEQPDARIINTSSPSGLYGNVGQANYGAAKAGIAAFSIISAMELGRYGVTCNAIAPMALTRMTEDLRDAGSMKDRNISPEAISPLVVWLGSAQSAAVTGRVFTVHGGTITVNDGWVGGPSATSPDGLWDPQELGGIVPGLVEQAPANADMCGKR